MVSSIGVVVDGSTSPDRKAYEERQEKLRHLQKEAFQLANYYFVFQCVIFTSLYSGPHTKEDRDVRCKYRWVPIALSSLAGGINLWAFVGFAWSYWCMLSEIDRVASGNTDGSFPIGMRLMKIWRAICAIICVISFLAFLVITIYACHQIACHHSTATPPPPTAA